MSVEDPPPDPPVRGAPFRDPELSKDALLERERQRSFARVHRETSGALARQAKQERIGDVLATIVVLGPLLGAVVIVAMHQLGMHGLLWMLCPCSVAFVCALLVVRYRAILRRRAAHNSGRHSS